MSLRKTLITTAFAAAVATATGASAQDMATDPAMTAPAPEEDDDGGKWGLLGLLGLAGLLGMKRRDRDDHRANTGTGTGTGTTR